MIIDLHLCTPDQGQDAFSFISASSRVIHGFPAHFVHQSGFDNPFWSTPISHLIGPASFEQPFLAVRDFCLYFQLDDLPEFGGLGVAG